MPMFRILAILSLTGLAACAGAASERSHEVTVITEPPGAG
jgi:ABC-type glycerol-3-phosphate transport system substrate-binding protein